MDEDVLLWGLWGALDIFLEDAEPPPPLDPVPPVALLLLFDLPSEASNAS